MNKIYRILTINPGSTSTKISLFENEKEIFTEVIRHAVDEIDKFNSIYDQLDFRKELILKILTERNIELFSIDTVVGRGGNMNPVPGGTYIINKKMLEDLKIGVMGQHASNLGGILAYEIANKINVPSYIVDPVVVDEFEDLARYSGIPEIQRKSKDHPLNQKAVARKVAAELKGEYNEFNFIIAHLGGGISIGVHKKGRIIDVNNALDGDGPFTPERSGGLPTGALIDLCFSGLYTKEEMRRKIVGFGGLRAYLGTNDGREVSKMIDQSNLKALKVYQAMAYQISKEIGAGSAVLKGDVDAIIITGGLAYDKKIVRWVEERVQFIAPVKVLPGEFEMEALAGGVLRVLNREEEVKEYR